MSDIAEAILGFFATALSVFMGAWLSHKYTIKNEMFNRRNNFKWEMCQTSWIPLCEIVENLIEEISVKKNIRIFYECQSDNKHVGFSSLFQYLKAPKRGGISPIKNNLITIKGKLKNIMMI